MRAYLVVAVSVPVLKLALPVGTDAGVPAFVDNVHEIPLVGVTFHERFVEPPYSTEVASAVKELTSGACNELPLHGVNEQLGGVRLTVVPSGQTIKSPLQVEFEGHNDHAQFWPMRAAYAPLVQFCISRSTLHVCGGGGGVSPHEKFLIFARVAGPATPVALRPLSAWNWITAAFVSWPKNPVGSPVRYCTPVVGDVTD